MRSKAEALVARYAERTGTGGENERGRPKRKSGSAATTADPGWETEHGQRASPRGCAEPEPAMPVEPIGHDAGMAAFFERTGHTREQHATETQQESAPTRAIARAVVKRPGAESATSKVHACVRFVTLRL